MYAMDEISGLQWSLQLLSYDRTVYPRLVVSMNPLTAELTRSLWGIKSAALLTVLSIAISPLGYAKSIL